MADLQIPSTPKTFKVRPERVCVICKTCGKERWFAPSQTARRQFCSVKCYGAGQTARAAERRKTFTFDDLWAMAIPEPNSGCLLWLGVVNQFGYGRYQKRQAHALAYELAVGPIPEGMEPDHLCRVHCCIEPRHLEPVTRLVNLQRSPLGILTRLGDMNRNKTHCPYGHPYDVVNTLRTKRGRVCRICKRAQEKRRDQLKKQEKANV